MKRTSNLYVRLPREPGLLGTGESRIKWTHLWMLIWTTHVY